MRVDYDAVAELYDATPHRAKVADPELLSFIGERGSRRSISVLDVGCGTGNQLIANRGALTGAFMVGLDRCSGMLHQARVKAPEIAWVQADGSMVPFRAETFDFVSCQFALHHMPNKADMLRETYRVLRPGGRFVIRNVCPQHCPDWLFYIYFPESLAIDLEDFWSSERTAAAMGQAGFEAVEVEFEHLRFAQDLRLWFEEVHQRGTCSQLLAIPDAAYHAGLQRLAEELAAHGSPPVRQNHVCLLTIRGGKKSLSS
jgi:SAM-dependent methyltransferase